MSIPYVPVPAGAAEIEDPINKSFQAFAALGQANVELTTNTPPTTTLSDVGKMWLAGTSPTGAWAGRANNLALCTAANIWVFYAPSTNVWLIWDKTALQMKRWDGSAWVVFSATSGSTSKGHIDGLKLLWVSGTAITVTTGEAYVEGPAAVVAAASNIAKTSLSLSNNTWYHVYLYLNAGVADVEIVTTVPAAAYNGTARSKTGDTSRRYLGSILSDGTANVIKFNHHASSSQVKWIAAVGNAPFMVLSGGNATTTTNVSLATVVPVTAVAADIQTWNTDTVATGRLGNSTLTATLTSSIWLARAFPNGTAVQVDQCLSLPIDGSQNFNYIMTGSPAAGGLNVRVAGYTFER